MVPEASHFHLRRDVIVSWPAVGADPRYDNRWIPRRSLVDMDRNQQCHQCVSNTIRTDPLKIMQSNPSIYGPHRSRADLEAERSPGFQGSLRRVDKAVLGSCRACWLDLRSVSRSRPKVVSPAFAAVGITVGISRDERGALAADNPP
jgi:hypothetical protein